MVNEELPLNIYYNHLEIYKILLSLYELRLACLHYYGDLATIGDVEEKKLKARKSLLTLICTLADTYEEDEGEKSRIKFNKYKDRELSAAYKYIIHELYYHYEDRCEPVIDDGEFDVLERFYTPTRLYLEIPELMSHEYLSITMIPAVLGMIEQEEERCKNLVKVCSKNKGVNNE